MQWHCGVGSAPTGVKLPDIDASGSGDVKPYRHFRGIASWGSAQPTAKSNLTFEFDPTGDNRVSMSGHQSAAMKNDEWLTPPEILRALGTFDLDPCAPVVRPRETAASHYTVTDDGLSKPWHGRVWCNPPFGREAIKWLRRMRDHGNGVALIPARTETAMFYETVWGSADGVLFLKGRPHFHYVCGRRADFNSGAPIALVAYGSANLDALRQSGLGFVVVGSNLPHEGQD